MSKRSQILSWVRPEPRWRSLGTRSGIALLALVSASGPFGVGAQERSAEARTTTVRVMTRTEPTRSSALAYLPASVSSRPASARSLPAPTPRVRWRPAGRRCHHRRGRHVCDGPRRVPVPYGHAAVLANALGMGTLKTASHLLLRPPQEDWVAAVNGEAPGPLLTWPVEDGRLYRGFGRVPRVEGGHRLHKGLDIGAPEGTPIVSVADGIVAYSDNGVSGYGNLALIVHADGSVAYYAHCKTIFVFAGQQVRKGQLIAEVGHTGLARGPHLHFELRVNGRPRDPIQRFAPLRWRKPVARRHAS